MQKEKKKHLAFKMLEDDICFPSLNSFQKIGV